MDNSLMQIFADIKELGFKLGCLGAIAWKETTSGLIGIREYTPKEGDRVICLYNGNGRYGTQATVVTVASENRLAYIKFDDEAIVPLRFELLLLTCL